ncbi:MAG: hypothetical protein LC109_11330 [Bacteroidia bacterium]|nr:hypothetical protein [Bacteroidia bacterium]
MDTNEIKQLIEEAIKKLVCNDDDIFKQKIPKLGKSTEKERKLNRELHETTLNHRLAFYLEQGLIEKKVSNYHVDIEYNRNFSDQKRVKISGIRIPVRPDILIHKRMRTTEETPHFLVVEAKKHKTTGHDISKVKGFMEDEKFLYKFGLTISYAYDPTKVKAILYYKDNQNVIKEEEIEVPRKNKTCP